MILRKAYGRCITWVEEFSLKPVKPRRVGPQHNLTLSEATIHFKTIGRTQTLMQVEPRAHDAVLVLAPAHMRVSKGDSLKKRYAGNDQ